MKNRAFTTPPRPRHARRVENLAVKASIARDHASDLERDAEMQFLIEELTPPPMKARWFAILIAGFVVVFVGLAFFAYYAKSYN